MLVIIYHVSPVEQHKHELRDVFLRNAGRLSRLLLSGKCDFSETVSILLNLLGQIMDVDRVCIWNLQASLWPTKD